VVTNGKQGKRGISAVQNVKDILAGLRNEEKL